MSRSMTLLVALVACLLLGWCGVSEAMTEGQKYAQIRAVTRYFNIVLDRNHDGVMSQTEYQRHLEEIDPSSTPVLPLSFTNIRHAELDLNFDRVVTVEELCMALNLCTQEDIEPFRMDEILSANLTLPSQIHLTASSTYDLMLVDWAQNITDINNAEVLWGTSPGSHPQGSFATSKTYTVSQDGLTYNSMPLFTANMSGLLPNTKYYYVVGTEQDGYSPEYSFVTLPDPTVPAVSQVTTRMITYGDQGTSIPMGATVCQWVEAENAINPFGILLHVGDLAYAGVNSWGEYEPTWDTWMEQISPIGVTTPYMTSVGNHEDFFNFTSYMSRFNMPGASTGGNGSFWFSFDQGTTHITSFSSESDYSIGSVQYQWIENDFIAARANPNVKWLIFAGHRPLYSSDQDEYSAHQPGCPLLVALEPLLIKYQVDMVLTGHEHMYERTWPVNNGTVVNSTLPAACAGQKDHENGIENDKQATFWNEIDESLPLTVFNKNADQPQAPVYIVQATAGVFQFDKVVDPQPVWSAYRLVGTWGYGVLSVSTSSSGCSTMLYQFRTVTSAGVQVVDQIILTKQVPTDEIMDQ